LDKQKPKQSLENNNNNNNKNNNKEQESNGKQLVNKETLRSSSASLIEALPSSSESSFIKGFLSKSHSPLNESWPPRRRRAFLRCLNGLSTTFEGCSEAY